MQRTDSTDPALVAARAAELLAMGGAAADALGRRAGNEADQALAVLEGIGASTSDLHQVNLRLVPLMASLQRDSGKHKWWRRFTGAQLEYDLNFDGMRREIEGLAATGKEDQADMARASERLRKQYDLMALELRLLEIESAAARLLASPAWAAQRAQAGFGDDELARLARRAANLEAMATATQLTRAQFKVAIQHARTVADRYREIQTLLLPIWRQSVGFDLFSRQTNAKEN